MDRFDRQRKIFGDEGQKRLGGLTVGVVGAGGLGSFMVLEFAYLGVGKILIVDDDRLDDEHTNRNRLVGAWESHAPGVLKVHILRDLALMIDSGIEVEVVEGRLESADAKAALAVAGIVVGCLDHDGPRFALNEFCCQHGLPLIDSASDTIPEEGEVVFGRASLRGDPRHWLPHVSWCVGPERNARVLRVADPTNRPKSDLRCRPGRSRRRWSSSDHRQRSGRLGRGDRIDGTGDRGPRTHRASGMAG